ncbi:hypothetical protein M407DRAFT_9666 [Tulasnella calospora MUT 4182]|uniref:Uncharacterized protein n=1 Tax=Tulasnella calospora MUT 4182 TaxID=1051891 RepID=A0A0C3KNS2_9AGAM|nr:hypothetical protein M407DRAFT_9666 [Tulasnella calospora MUT 4182]
MLEDFLIRLGIVHQPSAVTNAVPVGKQRQHLSNLYILPDGLLHPQFETKRNARGAYVPCWKSAFELALRKGQLKRIHNTANLHPLLVNQISHQLRSRVLQELIILHKRLEALRGHRRLKSPPNILRRLTAQELSSASTPSLSSSVRLETSCSQQPLAVITCPRQPTSETVADDQLATLPIQLDYPSPEPGLPPYELIPLDSSRSAEPSLPLYHGSKIFRLSAEQTRLRLALDRIIELDQQVPHGPQQRHPDPSGKSEEALEDSSDAYILQSPANGATVDPVPLAISLWRLMLWEGSDWRTVDDSVMSSPL